MAGVKSFEDLWIWQQARELLKQIRADFAMGTPGAGDAGFCDQLRRAGVSIMNNIAEGFERDSDAELARFLGYAKGSSGEVRSMYDAAEDSAFVTATTATERREKAKQISAGIASLKSHLKG